VSSLRLRGPTQPCGLFASLVFDIDESKPIDCLKIVIAIQGQNRRFPDDAEFKAPAETRNIYSMRQCHYLLVITQKRP
jgi:hypothetical protein